MQDTNVNKMKGKELRNIIRSIIKEAIEEATYAGRDSVNTVKRDPKFNTLSPLAKKSVEDELKKGETVKLGEMARTPEGYKLKDPNMDTAPYAPKKVSGVSVGAILDYIKANPGVTKKELQTQFGFVRPQIANQLVLTLLGYDVLVQTDKAGSGGDKAEPEFDEPKKKFGSDDLDAEDYFVGGSFDDSEIGSDDDEEGEEPENDVAPNDTQDEPEFEPEPEPELPVAQAAKPSTMSPAKEKAVDFFLDDSVDRLFRKIVASHAAAKLKIRESSSGPDDLSSRDFKSAELNRRNKATDELPALITRFADKIRETGDEEVMREILLMLRKKMEGIGYISLYKKVAKELGMNVDAAAPAPKAAEPTDLDVDDEEDEFAVAESQTLVERFQKLANIIK